MQSGNGTAAQIPADRARHEHIEGVAEVRASTYRKTIGCLAAGWPRGLRCAGAGRRLCGEGRVLQIFIPGRQVPAGPDMFQP